VLSELLGYAFLLAAVPTGIAILIVGLFDGFVLGAILIGTLACLFMFGCGEILLEGYAPVVEPKSGDEAMPPPLPPPGPRDRHSGLAERA